MISGPMSDGSGFWREKERLLARAGREFRRQDPAGVHDLRVALRRISATADAVGHAKLARRSKKIVRSLSDRRQLETNRRLLDRVRELGWLAPESAAGIQRLWEEPDRGGRRRRPPAGLRKVQAGISRLAEEPADDLRDSLRAARRNARRAIASVPVEADDRDLHRYRLRVKRARYVGEDLAAVGEPAVGRDVAREKRLQETLGDWNDLRLFRETLDDTRREAEHRGAVRLSSEISALVEALSPTIESARARALAAAHREASRGRTGGD
jgi:CHAD domain-containing protein